MGLSLKDIGKAINKGLNTVVDIGQSIVGSALPGGAIANNLIDAAQTINFNGSSGGTGGVKAPQPSKNPAMSEQVLKRMQQGMSQAEAIVSLTKEANAAGVGIGQYVATGQAQKAIANASTLVAKSGTSQNIGDILKAAAGGALAAAGGSLMGTKDGGEIGANALDSTVGTFFKRHWWKILLGVGAVTAVIVYVVRRGKSGKGKNFH